MCAGDFTPVDIEVNSDDLLIAADNGLQYLRELGRMPDVIIGDFDSLNPDYRGFLNEFQRLPDKELLALPVEKDDTDTLSAVRFGLKRGYRTFEIYGALGGRFDHSFANIQTLIFIKNQGAEGCILDEKQKLFILKDETLELEDGLYSGFSVFALDPVVRGVTIRGMKYELENAELTRDFPIGCSNELPAAGRAVITVREGMVLAVLRR